MGEGAAVACTAIVADRLPLARLLASDLAKVHPRWSLVVLVLDGELPGDGAFETVRPADLTPDRPGLLELMTDGPVSLAAALRPALMARSAERFDRPAVWLEPTVRVLGSLDPLVDAARDGVAVVPLHSGYGRPTGLGARGAFESGALAAGDLEALRWWASATADEACRPGVRLDRAADRLLDALVGAAERSHILRDPALCAGWWTFAAGGRLAGDPPEIDGVALRALNLAGFDPRRPHSLSSEDAAGDARVSQSLELATLLADHAERLIGAGWKPPRPRRWPYGALAGGIPVDEDLRELFALASRERVAFPSPFTEAGCAALLDWLDGESSLGRGVGRYLERVYRRRVDLQVAFPDLAGADGPRLAAWMEDHGGSEEPVLAALLKRRAEAGSGPDEQRRPAAEAGQPSVRVVGYLRDGLGLGEAARSYTGALRAVGVDVETVSVPVPLYGRPGADRPPRRREVPWDASSDRASDAPAAEIVCMNPPELVRLAESARPPDLRRIGVWAWELKEPPTGWSSAYSQVDGLWVFSEYVAAAFRDAPVPVDVVPLAVDVDRLASAAERAPSDGPFTFLFAFDLFSTLERKNPLGLIAAFRAAFVPGEGPRLLIKTSNGDNRPEELELLRIAALGRPDIEIVDAFVAPERRDALIAGCDCYVSLHRAEGFGLTLAEAMAAGRPTIATGFSGNLDFMTADTAYLIDSRPARVEAGSEIYPAGGLWREPDLHAAAAAMRRVYEDSEGARARGAKGREHVRQLLAPEVVGALARDRLQRLAPASRRRPVSGLRTALARRRARV
jgi:glycosyltransferase involved in cell wall biosynthesis